MIFLFCVGCRWISRKTGRQNWRVLILYSKITVWHKYMVPCPTLTKIRNGIYCRYLDYAKLSYLLSVWRFGFTRADGRSRHWASLASSFKTQIFFSFFFFFSPSNHVGIWFRPFMLIQMFKLRWILIKYEFFKGQNTIRVIWLIW